MDPVTWLVVGLIAAGVLAGGGFAGGYAAGAGAGGARTAEALAESQQAFAQEHTAQMTEALASMQRLTEARAHVSEQLAVVPPQCLPELGGDPLSVECQWAWCVRTGGSEGQRCEQSALVKLMVSRIEERSACAEPAP